MRVRRIIPTAALVVLAAAALGGCGGDKSESSTPSPDSTGTPFSEISPTPSPELTPEPSAELTPDPSPEIIATPPLEISEGSPSIPGCAVSGLISDLGFGGERHFASGDPIPMTLSLTNCSNNPVHLFYPDSQRYEFIVKDEEGNEVWRWSQDKDFTQGDGEETFEPGEDVTYNEVWDQRGQGGEQLSPGQYQILGLSVGCAESSASDCQFGVGLLIGIEP